MQLSNSNWQTFIFSL